MSTRWCDGVTGEGKVRFHLAGRAICQRIRDVEHGIDPHVDNANDYPSTGTPAQTESTSWPNSNHPGNTPANQGNKSHDSTASNYRGDDMNTRTTVDDSFLSSSFSAQAQSKATAKVHGSLGGGEGASPVWHPPLGPCEDHIDGFVVNSRREYFMVDGAQCGRSLYTDRPALCWAHLPSVLQGQRYISTPCDDYASKYWDLIRFTVRKPSMVLVLSEGDD